MSDNRESIKVQGTNHRAEIVVDYTEDGAELFFDDAERAIAMIALDDASGLYRCYSDVDETNVTFDNLSDGVNWLKDWAETDVESMDEADAA